MKLEELAAVTRGIGVLKKHLDPSAGDPYRLVQIRHIQEGTIAALKGLKPVYLSSDREPQRFIIKAGDILVAMTGAKPKVAVIEKAPRRCLADSHIGIIRPKSVAAGKRIAKHLKSVAGQDVLRSLQSGVTIPHIKGTDLKAVEVP